MKIIIFPQLKLLQIIIQIYDNTNYSIQSNLSSLINKKNNSYYPSPNFSNYNIINQIYSFQKKIMILILFRIQVIF